jgi:xylan 1,4-beta-xylosidase
MTRATLIQESIIAFRKILFANTLASPESGFSDRARFDTVSQIMFSRLRHLIFILLLGSVFAGAGADPTMVEVDFARTNGVLRPLHGINKGPLEMGGLIDLTEEQRALRIPFTRLHDCHWPNPDVVDIHAVFPDPNSDPARPESYQFAATDEYLERVRATGAGIVYRLGESIEHSTVKRYVHPPRDMEKWAQVCLGIIRHYNEGWANGFRHNIRYWEIWNEPENRPAMWSGSDDDYFRLYRTAARAIRKEFPGLKVGGPSVGAPGNFVGDRFQPTAFVTHFLALCRRESLPLDFFSWHCYTDDPAELVRRAKAIRGLLDAGGFAQTESHLNEWNFLPGNTWAPISRTAKAETRQRFYEEMSGAAGAAFITAALIRLQDAPLDMGNLFHGGIGAFGLFNEHGVPAAAYYGVRAFSELLKTPERVWANFPATNGVVAVAGMQARQRRGAVLLSRSGNGPARLELRMRNVPGRAITFETWRLDRERSWVSDPRRELPSDSEGHVRIDCDGPSVVLVRLRWE